MCTTVVWSVNRAAYTPEFVGFTKRCLGVAPQDTDLRIIADAVRPTAAHFTLVVNGCDCSALVGRGGDALGRGEIGPDAWLAWLGGVWERVPYLTGVAFMPVWSPVSDAVRPAGAVVELAVGDVTERLLRGVRHDELVVVRSGA